MKSLQKWIFYLSKSDIIKIRNENYDGQSFWKVVQSWPKLPKVIKSWPWFTKTDQSWPMLTKDVENESILKKWNLSKIEQNGFYTYQKVSF